MVMVRRFLRCATALQYIERMLKIHTEEQIASLVGGSGAIWTTHALATNLSQLHELIIPPAGPIAVCSLGVFMWLHAKWRRNTKIQ